MAEQKIYDETYIVYSPWNGGNTKHISLDSDADESVLNEFTITTDVDWIILSDPIFTSYIKDTNGARVCMADFKWSVGTNESKADRVGTICITRSSEVNNYIVNIQVTQWGGILSADEIPEDAYKVIVPGVTPWFTTIDSEDFPEYNIGRAEKVIYEPDSFLRNPSAVLCIPGATEHTRAHLIKIYPEFDNDKLNFRSFSAGVNPYQDWAAQQESTRYPGFKTAGGIGIGVSMSENFGHEANVKGISYKNIKLIFYVENYDNQIGNYIAIPVQYVLCRGGLIREEFDKIVEIFGPANYDGTMHDLHKFDFTSKEISPKYTPWVSTRNTGGLSMVEAGTNKYYEDETYGRAEKVLYMSCDNMTGAEASIFVPGKCDATKIEYYVDVDKCVNMEDPANDLWLWDNGKDNGWWDMPIEQASSSTKHYGIKFVPSSNFLPDHIGLPTYQQNHRSTVINFVVHDYCRTNSDYFEGNAIVIPFRIVQCKSGITKAEFDELVKIYGPSNYDGTINDLSVFNFDDTGDSNTSTPETPSTPEQLIIPEGKFTSDDLTISAEGGTFWTRFDITNMTYEYYNNLISPRGKAHSAEVTWQNEKFFSDENEWVYGKLGAVNAHLKKDRTTGKPYLYVKYSVNPNTTNYKLTSYMIYRYWGTIKGSAQINADPLFECKIPVYQLPASDTVTKTESLPDKPVGIAGETAVGAVECGYTNTLDVFAIAEEDIKTKLNVYSTAEWLKIKDITYNKN